MSHFLATLVELPLSADESRVVSERAAVLSQHPRFHLRSNLSFSSLGGSGDDYRSNSSSSGSSSGHHGHQGFRGGNQRGNSGGAGGDGDGAGAGVGAIGEGGSHSAQSELTGSADGGTVPTIGSSSPLLGMFTAACGTNSNPHYTPAMLSGNTGSRGPPVFPFSPYAASLGAPVPFSLLYPPVIPSMLSAQQFMAQYPLPMFAHPSSVQGAGMVAPGEVYLSQEALRNNPNAQPRAAPKRETQGNPEKQGDQGTK